MTIMKVLETLNRAGILINNVKKACKINNLYGTKDMILEMTHLREIIYASQIQICVNSLKVICLLKKIFHFFFLMPTCTCTGHTFTNLYWIGY